MVKNHSVFDTFAPRMVKNIVFIDILLVGFQESPLGGLGEHFSDIWVSIGDPLGVHWGSLRSLWIPLGTLWTPLGSLWQSLAPLGYYLDDFCVVLGPSDHKSSPEGDDLLLVV